MYPKVRIEVKSYADYKRIDELKRKECHKGLIKLDKYAKEDFLQSIK